MKYPSLLKRIWICFSNYRAWRIREAIGKSACYFWNTAGRDEEKVRIAFELMEFSDKLWAEAFRMEIEEFKKGRPK